MNLLRIGEMAKLNKISVQTLHYYEKVGLLKPQVVDTDTGYRFYHVRQCAKLDLIGYMKLLGMSLTQIKQLFEKNDISLIQENITNQLDWIEMQKDNLLQMERGVRRFLFSLKEYVETSQSQDVELLTFPERKIFCYDGRQDIYQGSIETYEYIIRELKDQARLKHLPMIYFCNVGSLIRQKNIRIKNFYSTEIFVFVDGEFPDSPEIETIPAGTYACLSFRGEDGFANELDYAERLLAYIARQGFAISGDYLCEVVAELPVYDEKTRGMFIRIQVPVISA